MGSADENNINDMNDSISDVSKLETHMRIEETIQIIHERFDFVIKRVLSNSVSYRLKVETVNEARAMKIRKFSALLADTPINKDKIKIVIEANTTAIKRLSDHFSGYKKMLVQDYRYPEIAKLKIFTTITKETENLSDLTTTIE
jgi:hypothetical protein